MDLPTPCLILERDKLLCNVQSMSQRVATLGVQLRAHMKTSKCAEVMHALPNASGTAPPIAVSTLREAEYLFDAGARDLLHTVPLALTNLDRARALANRGASLSVLLDTPSAVRALLDSARRQPTANPVGVLLEIDSDGYRGGLAPDSPALIECARLLLEAPSQLPFRGVYAYAGRTYAASDASEGAQIVERCRRAALAAAERLRQVGLTNARVCLGGSPVATFADSLDGVDELCAGVWMFNDLFQHGLGVCALQDIAVSVLATVVSANEATDTVFLDAGALALSQDRSTAKQPRDRGFGLLIDVHSGEPIDDFRVSAVSQEHGHIAGPGAVARFPIGTRVRVLPNHACMTAAAFDGYHVATADRSSLDYWPRVNGW